MLDNFGGATPPGTFTLLQIHIGDAYATTWGNARDTFYAVAGTPDAWFDGVAEASGSYSDVTLDYNRYLGIYNTRRVVATDVTIQLNGRLLSGNTYEVKATVGIEAGGTGKTLRIYLAQVLDHYPTSPSYSRYCFIQAATTHGSEDVITVTPGHSQIVTRNFTFSGASLAALNNVKIVAWAQANSSKNVWQAATMSWPFTPAEPPLGDMDGDLDVDFDDVDDFVLALVDPAGYQDLHPTLDPVTLGDANGDDALNGLDIQLFIPLLGVDMEAPTPNPMTFATLPTPNSGTPTTALDMVATTASDSTPPVQYAFETNAGPEYPGASARDWGAGRTYSDTGLTPNTTYVYRVKARDGATVPNETSPSADASAVTYALIPGAPILSSPTTMTMNVDVVPDADATLDNPAWTEFAIHCKTTTDANWNGKFVSATGSPSAGAVWQTDGTWGVTVITGLQPGTSYQFEVKARNTNNIETVYGSAATLATP